MHPEDKVWIEYREKFSKIYDHSNYSNSIQGYSMRASHKFIEKAYSQDTHFSKVLEIGAGTGNHLSYVRHTFDEYFVTDIDQETLTIARQKIMGTSCSSNLLFEVQTAEHLTYPDNSFDRLVAVHVLEHMEKPHKVLKEWARVVKPGGILSILIPTDPGVAWRLGRRMGPRRNAVSQGIAYDYVMAREHINSCNNLIALLRHYFPKSKENWWPFSIPAIDLNLFFSFHSKITKQN